MYLVTSADVGLTSVRNCKTWADVVALLATLPPVRRITVRDAVSGDTIVTFKPYADATAKTMRRPVSDVNPTNHGGIRDNAES